jgi:hypothetical protein
MSFDEFEDLVSDFIHENVFPAGEEFDYSRKYTENLKELYEQIKK